MAETLSFNLVKPDAFARGLIGKIITRFEEKGLTLIDLKYVEPTEAQITAMYEDRATEPVFPQILAYLVGQPVLAMVWTGEDASEKARLLIGEKDPLDSESGSIRGSMADDRVHNLVHGSRTDAEARQEAMIFFPERYPGTPTPAADRPAAQAPKFMEWWSPDGEEVAL